jgi:CBS domain containing-hemolysin-like protein
MTKIEAPAYAPLAFKTIAFLHLTVGEQALKIGAFRKARTTTLLVAYPLTVSCTVFKPFIRLINVSSNAVLRIVGLKQISPVEEA